MPFALTEKVPLLIAFRSRNYRLYWGGMLVSVTGYQIQQITLLWLVYDLTASPLYLGLVGGVHGIATIAFLLFGGVLADRIDRRRLLLATNFFFFFLLILIAISTAAQVVTVWHLLVYSLLSGAVTAFDQPTRHALLPHLLEDRRHLMNAIAMHSTIFQTARILGPAVAGILITDIGVAPCFFIAAGSYLAMVCLAGGAVCATELYFQLGNRHGLG
jgi:MFS family permease